MEVFKRYYANLTVRRFGILVLIGLLLYSIRDMLNLVLLTFLIAYVMNSFQVLLTKRISKFIKVNSKVIIVILYLALIAMIVLALIKYLPKVFEQVKQLTTYLSNLTSDDIPQNQITLYLFDTLKDLNYQSYLKGGIDYVFKISNWGTTFVLSTILSFVFILEKGRIVSFTSRLRESKISWFYVELEYFGKKFISSFGKVIEAQILIALFNTVFTVIGLWILGMFFSPFPYLFALSIMIFLLSLIPVVGFVISLVPLCIIGYNIGGLEMVIYVLAMIAVLHFMEGYFLNPKLMSSKMNLPMFYTFIVLLFSEHYIGVWGLILGIPIFVFFLDILDVTRDEPAKLLK
ncbi:MULTISPECIES: AI-2E family transporter [unclassified Paenibacillus]|uniref:AI-2E family transporter n=1 Tax=unclassified Paenibacillus TaxID=185978 RepID=UPI002405EFD7|nr:MULTISPECIES: AI-2E family transporter [unclassified Paenibacillus]MDF9840854.1 putative PurR-regulated permease PerM [Paenibacillus sp. PastF-2]MDF9847438.1 putative PurR-regulated permease PerM [Paenibacillus sp. PastM-2]MDF9853985.1 putative PurR-regulated permease PerM [Paenibacillus sp. PastF-1]MDH6479257.1 putative PurR-regulated permease PerM [Paenibacillus sp. PastH-2]MDH6507007.1 putative PurR-regulated permease PerM [Paenibacillus sp. PastM-3]